MGISLTDAKVVADMADVLYSFLPGSFSSVTFETVAKEVGVGTYWQGGSKKPAITALLGKTLEYKRPRFESLILAIVQAGLQYRQRKSDPIRKEEILKLIVLLQKISFQFPDLCDQKFLDSLEPSPSAPSPSEEEMVRRPDPIQENAVSNFRERLERLKAEFYVLHSQTNRQQAGLDLEKLLGKLFELHGLAPRSSFRVQGEQIDGSFTLDNQIYLLEAKWVKDPVSEEPLLVFRGKVEGKSAWTRGLFIALNAFSNQALQSIVQGKQPTFLLMDGYDLTVVLEGQCRLDDLLRAKVRYLSEEGKVFVSAREILQDGSIGIGTS